MMVMLITTCLTTLYMLVGWEVPLYIIVPFSLLYITIEATYLSSNLLKVPIILKLCREHLHKMGYNLS